ncbi:hypothetical protein ISF_05166 [Cordyceps fumosorosea ARSEF 2679]|uniref:Uncharacterized protein n=1 Tax=Cordyceps fumosorosea (strain ARSEF 2679) TaxID=1081104 RepID=A0A167V2F3_CORFA|nr:hypothetical protein ISF_05166 [Cordyceps fumosorosea ARSEF 2679]OAA62157.1 hypothetical protein ISF_05166 [Cordyceps fumosorosea ARSEF 2679]
MDEPGWAWPAWKFNMKRGDLFTSLHDQYNTVSFSLQDPEAFHHDVFELSHQADTAEEFHQLMAERKGQRTKEMNDCLESLAVEIIANPKLMGTDQWQHAVQLFRTKSYDSIVRYFASYIPEELVDEKQCPSPVSETVAFESDSACTTGTKLTEIEDMSQFLDHDDFFPNGPVMMVDPCPMDAHGPPSPPHSASTPSEYSDDASYPSTGRSSRSASFSASESGRISGFLRDLSKDDDDTTSQSDSGETVTSAGDSVETISSVDPSDHYHDSKSLPMTPQDDEDWDIYNLPIQYELDDDLTYDTLDSETATPKPLSEATNYLEHPCKATVIRALCTRRSQPPKSYIRNRTSATVSRANSRRTPEEVFSRIQKAPAEAARRRPKGTMGLD